MVIADVWASAIVLEDPFDERGKYPISATREEWEHVLATTEEFVKSEFVRIAPKPKAKRKTAGGRGE